MNNLEKKQKIDELYRELENVRGTPAEVYTRIVGYFRPVQYWNDGKQQEYINRKTFDKSIKIRKRGG